MYNRYVRKLLSWTVQETINLYKLFSHFEYEQDVHTDSGMASKIAANIHFKRKYYNIKSQHSPQKQITHILPRKRSALSASIAIKNLSSHHPRYSHSGKKQRNSRYT